jgi:hypothetical protein
MLRDGKLRKEAMMALRHMKSYHPVAIRALVRMLREIDDAVVNSAVESLQELIRECDEQNFREIVNVFVLEFPMYSVGYDLEADHLLNAVNNAPSIFRQLMAEFNGSDFDASKHAFTKLLKLGSAIHEVIEWRQYSNQTYKFEITDFGDQLNEIGQENPSAFDGLVDAIMSRNEDIQYKAIYICASIKPIHPLLLEAICQSSYSGREDARLNAITGLYEFKDRTPSIFELPSVMAALIGALNDSYDLVQDRAFHAIYMSDIPPSPNPALLKALIGFLEPNRMWKSEALYALSHIGAFDPMVLRAVRRVAVSEFHYDRVFTWEEEASGWAEYRVKFLKEAHERDRKLAAQVFQQLTGPYLEIAQHTRDTLTNDQAQLPQELKKRLGDMFAIELERKAWDWLRVFYYVGKCGSYYAAASELGLSHANVPGRSMKEFQECLKVKLLVSRRAHGTSLTSEGSLIWNWVKGLFEPQQKRIQELTHT